MASLTITPPKTQLSNFNKTKPFNYNSSQYLKTKPFKVYCAATKNLPPGPTKLPLIGNLHNLIGSLPHHALRDLAREYGPLMHLQLGEIPAVIVSSPEMAQEVMRTHDLVFAKRPEFLASKIITYNGKDIAFAPHSEYWKQMRKVCMLELLSPKRVQSFTSLRESEVSSLIESIRMESNSGNRINFTEKMFFMTTNIIFKAAFGGKRKDQEAIIAMAKEATTLASGFDVVDLFPSLGFLQFFSGLQDKLEKLNKEMDFLLENIIDDHKKKLMDKKQVGGKNVEENNDEDLVDVLLSFQSDGSLPCPITNVNIKAVIMDLFIAGTDTSSTTVEWAMSEMMKNPRVLKKAQSEVRDALNGKKTISEADIQELKYLKAVIKETLRLHPPAPLLLPRESQTYCKINGYDIPIKTKVIVNAWAIGRDAEYWQDSEEFNPERYDDNNIDFKGVDFGLIPFGAGRRICPGMGFGLANIELPLALLLYHFDWKLPSGVTPETLDMTEQFGATVGRKNHLCLTATPYSYVPCSSDAMLLI